MQAKYSYMKYGKCTPHQSDDAVAGLFFLAVEIECMSRQVKRAVFNVKVMENVGVVMSMCVHRCICECMNKGI